MEPLPEKLQLHGSDHLGMVLVSAPLIGNNYLNWSSRIKRVFRAKMKLGFIDGTSEKPLPTDPFFEQWIRVDSMVTTWILNSMSKDIALWDEMAELKLTPQYMCRGCTSGTWKAVEDSVAFA
ncbi:UNVERIFIED_CONTAM: hypothetical protein Sindi_1352000 [Sesamum indicum]